MQYLLTLNMFKEEELSDTCCDLWGMKKKTEMAGYIKYE